MPLIGFYQREMRGSKGRGTKDEGRRTRDEGRRTRDEGRGTRDEGRGTRDEGRGTKDEGRGTKDEGRKEGEKLGGWEREGLRPLEVRSWEVGKGRAFGRLRLEVGR